MKKKIIRNIVNIKYIAKISGFSPSTVSRALRGDPNTNKKTADKILKISKELKYYPNLLAKGLRNKKTKTIGIILNDIRNPYYYETIKIIEDKLNNLGYTMILSDSNYDSNIEKKNIITMLSNSVDGIIISPVNIESENIALIRENELKAVFIDYAPKHENINFVHVNHEQAALLATEYMIKKGHKEILLLNGPFQLSVSKDFLKGYIQTLKNNGINLKKSLIKSSELNIEKVSGIIKNTYNSINKSFNFTSVVCISDMHAIGVYAASKELGFKIPQDLSIIGCDNIFMSNYLSPPLTTIHLPKIKIGKLCIEILLNQIEKNDIEYRKIILDIKLIERESVKEINNLS